MSLGVMCLGLKKYWVYEVMKMKKKALLRGLRGLPVGIAIGYVLSLIASYIFGDGTYSAPCTPALVSTMGNEINALILQTLLYGVIGASFAAGTVVFEVDRWSLAKQTGVYFLIVSLVTLPTAYILSWMEHSLMGFLNYFSRFIFYFVIIWIIKYLVWRNSVKKMNEKLRKIQADEQKSS